MYSVRLLVAVFALVFAGAIVLVSTAVTTPMYTARAGRTCDNCHVTPNDWVDPKLSERKCTLSCQGCHVDPAGGGMRNVVGRFYGRSTLPMIAYSAPTGHVCPHHHPLVPNTSINAIKSSRSRDALK